jgi:hypothetical protein
MPHKKGTRLGGIDSVEALKKRCIVDDDTGCWHWCMAFTEGAPKVHYWHPVTGERCVGKGRRVALILARGKDLPPKNLAWQRMCCASSDCVNPDHARSGSKAEWGRWLSSTGRVKNLPAKCAASRKAWDKRGRTITPEMVTLIRHSDKSNMELAAELGCSSFAIWCVRMNKCHTAGMRNSSVFAWMP